MPTDTLDFQSVDDRFRPRVLRYVARIAGAGDADDLAQQVMLRISEGLPRFRGESSLSTWIYRIATNVALDHLRRKAIPAPIDLEDLEAEGKDPPEARSESVEATAIREEMSACIREFVERLPQDYRTVMALAELEGFRNAEIAAVLGVSLDTVKIRLHRAREAAPGSRGRMPLLARRVRRARLRAQPDGRRQVPPARLGLRILFRGGFV
jgi:RNA polymerase sigma-70 factor (ECF subfamily)